MAEPVIKMYVNLRIERANGDSMEYSGFPNDRTLKFLEDEKNDAKSKRGNLVSTYSGRLPVWKQYGPVNRQRRMFGQLVK